VEDKKMKEVGKMEEVGRNMANHRGDPKVVQGGGRQAIDIIQFVYVVE
jgi:hypothetical protein